MADMWDENDNQQEVAGEDDEDEEEEEEEEEDILDMEDAPAAQQDALLMRFCPHDSSMLYPQVCLALYFSD